MGKQSLIFVNKVATWGGVGIDIQTNGVTSIIVKIGIMSLFGLCCNLARDQIHPIKMSPDKKHSKYRVVHEPAFFEFTNCSITEIAHCPDVIRIR